MFFLFFVNNDFDVQAAFQKERNEKKRFLNIFYDILLLLLHSLMFCTEILLFVFLSSRNETKYTRRAA